MCKAEVTTEDAVKGDTNLLNENVVMLLRGTIRTIKCHIESRTQEPLSDDSLVIPWLVEHAGCILSRFQKGRDGRTPFERLHGKKLTQEFAPFGEKVLARQITTEPRIRMNPRYQYGFWLGMRNNSAECFIGNADGVFRARETRRLEHSGQMGHGIRQQCDWTTVEDDGRKVDSGQTGSLSGLSADPPSSLPKKKNLQFPVGVCLKTHQSSSRRWCFWSHWVGAAPRQREQNIETCIAQELPFEGARVQRERITKQDIDEFGATVGCPGCNAFRDNKRAQAHSDRCRMRIEECLRNTPHGAERLDRRIEVIKLEKPVTPQRESSFRADTR